MKASERSESAYEKVCVYQMTQEQWLSDHHSANECVDWENAIATSLQASNAVRSATERWKSKVSNLEIRPEVDEERLVECHQLWLKNVAALIEFVERKFAHNYDVEGMEKLKAEARYFQDTLDNWTSPRRPILPSVRGITLCRLESEQFRQSLEAPPPPVPTGLRSKEISREEFFTNLKKT